MKKFLCYTLSNSISFCYSWAMNVAKSCSLWIPVTLVMKVGSFSFSSVRVSSFQYRFPNTFTIFDLVLGCLYAFSLICYINLSVSNFSHTRQESTFMRLFGSSILRHWSNAVNWASPSNTRGCNIRCSWWWLRWWPCWGNHSWGRGRGWGALSPERRACLCSFIYNLDFRS